MHLLELEQNWAICEIVFSNGKSRDLKDLMIGLAPEGIANGAVVFILKRSGKKIYMRPCQASAQKLIFANRGGGRRWKTIGAFKKFNEVKIQREIEKRKSERAKQLVI